MKSDKKLKQFVKNRVDSIRAKTDIHHWFHVSTGENIADILSRGATFEDLEKSCWFEGPDWIKSNKDTWPITGIMDLTTQTSVSLTASLEMDNEFHANASQTPQVNMENVFDTSRYSSYDKLLRITALVIRAFKPGGKNRTELTARDIRNAENLWITHIQNKHYGPVLEYLRAEQDNQTRLPKKPSIINQLGLTLDSRGTIRCGGRISNANVSPDRKFPVLLPHFAHFTQLVIAQAHHNMVHYGTGYTMSYLRNKFWITSMRSTVKKVIRRCRVCKRVTGRAYLTPLAPPLPDFRLNDLNAFESTAMDFTAHLYVKMQKTTQKVYICLFTCCTTRAIHLEIVPDMTCTSFLRAFRRFTSNYSVPKLLYCDNAKTFKSGEEELKKLYKIVGSENCQKHFATKGIDFKYTPVESPWFGAVHERVTGVTKNAVKKTFGKALVSYDELCTIIKEIQAVLNNRPLTHVSSDPKELTPITPNHLIYGHGLAQIPHGHTDEGEFDPSYKGKVNLEKCAHRRAKLLEHFRKRFADESSSLAAETHVRNF